MVRVLLENRHVVCRRRSRQSAGLDEFLCHRDFGHRIFGERYADGVCKAIEQQGADASCRLQASVGTRARFRDTYVERVRLKAFLLDSRGEHTVGGNRHARVAALEAEDHLVKMFSFAHGQVFHGAFHHAFHRVAVAVNHAGRERTVVYADADGASQALCLLHERRKGFCHLFLAFVKRFVRLLVERQNACIDKVTRIDADFLHPLERLERGLRLEVDVCRNRHRATGGTHLLHHFFKCGSICKCRSGNANKSAPHLGKRQCFGHRLLDVFRLGGGHGLN